MASLPKLTYLILPGTYLCGERDTERKRKGERDRKKKAEIKNR